MPFVFSALALLALVSSASGSCGDEDCARPISLLQSAVHYVTQQATGKNVSSGLARADRLLRQMETHWTTGFWARDLTFGMNPCATSTFQELQVTLPKWRAQNPGVDGFCHFQNHALWFASAGKASIGSYKNWGMGALHMASDKTLCDSTGDWSIPNGAELTFSFDAGTFTWTQVRNCIDVVDDPYCYSLGWLKGQGSWGESLMSNKTAWEQLAKQECQKIQEEFHFDDEEVTVGRHIFSTPLYFKRTWNSLKGKGTPIGRRLHKEHVYTKCLLDDGAPSEMAYCYYKGCMLPGNRLGHYDECSYER